MIRIFKITCSLAFIGMLLVACISPRKFDERMLQSRNKLNEVRDSLRQQTTSFDSLEMLLIGARGGNEQLLNAQQQLQDRLLALDDEIERLNGSLSNTQNDLGKQRQALENQNSVLSKKLAQLKQSYRAIASDYQAKLSEVARQVALDSVVASKIDIRSRAGSLSLNVQQDVLFRSSTSTRLSPDAKSVLNSIAAFMEANPLLELSVIGHTDNQQKFSAQGGNRAFSAKRAVVLADELTSRYYLSANRITAAGMGDAKPLESNATSSGRAANRRIEFLVTNSVVNLLRELEKAEKEFE